MQKLNVGILGTGLVGSDLLTKVQKSPYLDCVMFAGIREDSPGIAKAKKMGVNTSAKSIDAIGDNCELVFDVTNANAHIKHAPILETMEIFTVDLTPSKIGKMCVPSINLEECLKEPNVNLISCGCQAMAKIAKDIMIKHPDIKYLEIVSAIASESAGMGTRNNIDEYIQTTADALEELTGVPKAKAILIINPAVPPIDMRNTLMYEVNGKLKSITKIVKTTGKLPGNLDIINRSAITVAEAYAKN